MDVSASARGQHLVSVCQGVWLRDRSTSFYLVLWPRLLDAVSERNPKHLSLFKACRIQGPPTALNAATCVGILVDEDKPVFQEYVLLKLWLCLLEDFPKPPKPVWIFLWRGQF